MGHRPRLPGRRLSPLPDLLAGLAAGSLEVVDLTAPLSEDTPVLQLPPPFADTRPFTLSEAAKSRTPSRHPPLRARPVVTTVA